MNDEELKAIERRARRATRGKWEASADKSGVFIPVKGKGVHRDGRFRFAVAVATNELVPTAGFYNPYAEVRKGEAAANMEFIAHAREDVPALVAEVKRLQKQLAQAQGGSGR